LSVNLDVDDAGLLLMIHVPGSLAAGRTTARTAKSS
jgi:hypothetical protein